MERTLDWAPAHDPRSRAWRATTATTRLRECDWRLPLRLDQGWEGACVGFAAAHQLASTRRARQVDARTAREVYRRAQRMDEWVGEDYEGTSVLAGMKALAAMGWIKRYEWSFTLLDVLRVLSWKGPVQIGCWWWTGMFDADAEGWIRRSGRREGGHSVLLSGVHPATRTVTVTNSWGPGWGRNGQAELGWDDLGALLDDDGEAVSVVKTLR